jgi:hypothetical protein
MFGSSRRELKEAEETPPTRRPLRLGTSLLLFVLGFHAGDALEE